MWGTDNLSPYPLKLQLLNVIHKKMPMQDFMPLFAICVISSCDASWEFSMNNDFFLTQSYCKSYLNNFMVLI